MLGRLPSTPYDDPRDAPSYVDAGELLADARVDAVALVPEQADLLPALRDAGLLVLLTGPVLDAGLLRRARAAEGPDVAVALSRRWEPWARTAAAALPLAGGPVRQVTVRGWPRGERETVELVDLARGWCGDVLAAGAGPAVAAPALPGGAPVAWSLLCASGATVLVSHEGAPVPTARLTLATARLDAAVDEVRWDGGEAMALPPGGLGPDAGLVASAAALRGAVALGEVEARAWPWPADLGDLLAAATVLGALRASARTGTVTSTT